MILSIYESIPFSGVSYYRSLGVFQYLNRLNKNIEIKVPAQITWPALAGVNLFYMERPSRDPDMQAFRMAKDFNIPVWVDYDDILHEIPRYNPVWEMYKTQPKILKNMEECIKSADIVTVSTQAIKDYYSKFNPNIIVIENAHNDYQYPFLEVKETVNSINWRGSNTHREDIRSVAAEIFALAKTYPEWAWTWMGSDLWYITEGIKTFFSFKECDIIDYFKFIRELRSAIQINPLLDNIFNRGKSNISWLEATYAGSVAIVPDFPEFNKPGALCYKDAENFSYLLGKAIKSKDFRHIHYLQSYNYIKDNLLLSQINKKRLDIIEGIK